MIEKICILFSIVCLIALIFVIIRKKAEDQRLAVKLAKMIDSAAAGTFCESDYDESELSFIEGKMAKFLAAGELSANKIEAERDKIKELIGDISHQTKTPIANILLYSQLLTEQIQTDPAAVEKYAGAVGAMSEQADKLNFLIASLVKTSRLEAGIISVDPAENSVETLVAAVCKQIEAKANSKNIEVKSRDIDGELTGLFDMKWTTEALFNILDNAVKYTPWGGVAEISVRKYEMFVRIDVSDNGIGIAEEEQSKIFIRFYRSQEVSDQEGVGIGLYLAREIMAAQNGYIKLKSEKGKGTTFSLYIPAN